MAKKWTEKEIDALKTCYDVMQIKDLMQLPELMYRSREAIYQKAKQLGLTKNRPRGELTDHAGGWKVAYFPLCPYAWADGRVYEHVLVWWLNRPLDTIKKNEIIHHLNRDKTDNRISNLQKMRRTAHIRLHRQNGDLRKW